MLRLVINLDRSKERLKRISDSLMNFGLRFSRVQAVDGRLLSEAEIKQLVIPKWKRQLFFRELTRSGDQVLIDKNKHKINNRFEVVRIIKPHHIGAVAYFIHRDVARLALEATRQLEAPVDEVLFSLNYPIGRKYAGWMVNPYVVRPDFVIESTIGHRKEDGGYGSPFTAMQRWRKFTTRINISVYRKLYGNKFQVSFE